MGSDESICIYLAFIFTQIYPNQHFYSVIDTCIMGCMIVVFWQIPADFSKNNCLVKVAWTNMLT